VWFEPTELPAVYGIHLAVDPEWRKRWPVLKIWPELLDRIKEDLNSPGLLVIPEGSTIPTKFTERLGFHTHLPSGWRIRTFGREEDEMNG